MAWGNKFDDKTSSSWIVVVLAPKMFPGGIVRTSHLWTHWWDSDHVWVQVVFFLWMHIH